MPAEPVSVGHASQTRFTFGVYHSEAEFVSKAIDAGHPRDLYGQLPLEMQNCVDSLSIMPESSVIAKRAAWFTKWTKRAREIQRAPDPEWVIDDPAMAKILDQKRLQLLDEIISPMISPWPGILGMVSTLLGLCRLRAFCQAKWCLPLYIQTTYVPAHHAPMKR